MHTSTLSLHHARFLHGLLRPFNPWLFNSASGAWENASAQMNNSALSWDKYRICWKCAFNCCQKGSGHCALNYVKQVVNPWPRRPGQLVAIAVAVAVAVAIDADTLSGFYFNHF